MQVSILKETYPGERRVAIVPANVVKLAKAGIEVLVQPDAGKEAGFSDEQYADKGATIVRDRASLFAADVVAQVRALGANSTAGQADLEYLRPGCMLIGTCDPLGAPQAIQQLSKTGARLFALELIPRITRAQSMDVLSSQATIAGYRAVLLGATELPKMFPMMMTAAGTLAAARVFVIGTGVAGLQAIATARRLGAVVHAYDVRPATREQVESLGGKFVELAIESEQTEDGGGYAKAMDDTFYRKQRELMASVVAESDVVVSTAAIPGKPSPLLITEEAVRGMPAGGVIVDLAAERGGNCALSKPDQRVVQHDVVILGPTNLPAEVPNHASQMFSNNMTRFLLNLVSEGQWNVNMEDEIIRETLVCQEGQVTHPRIRQLLGQPPIEASPVPDESDTLPLEPADDAPDVAGEPPSASDSPESDPSDNQEHAS